MRTRATIAALALLALPASARADEPATARLYGTLRLDLVLGDRLDDTIAPTRADDEQDPGDEELAIHPRLSRIGLEITPQSLDTATDVSGLVEVDFAGEPRDSVAALRLRHAYVQARRGRFELVAGQTFDLASPLIPSVNGASMMWDSGNTGAFRPQIRVAARTRGRRLRVNAALAAGMPGAVDHKNLDADDGDTRDDGAVSLLPAGQALLEVEHARGRLGVSGHAGRDRPAGPVDGRFSYTALMIGAHLRVAVTERLWLHGEAFAGHNLTDVRGGAGQGVNATMGDGREGREVRAAGGWGEIGFDGGPRWAVLAGAGIDNPKNDDVADGGVQRNQAAWLAATTRVWGTGSISVDYIYWATDYRGLADTVAHRFDLALALDW